MMNPTTKAVEALAEVTKIIEDQQRKHDKVAQELLRLEGILADAYDRTGQTLNTDWDKVYHAHNLLRGILWVLTETFPEELGLHDLPNGKPDVQS